MKLELDEKEIGVALCDFVRKHGHKPTSGQTIQMVIDENNKISATILIDEIEPKIAEASSTHRDGR